MSATMRYATTRSATGTAFRVYAASMGKEVRQGLGLVVVAVLLAVLWAAADARILGAAAFLVVLGGLALVAKGLLRPAVE